MCEFLRFGFAHGWVAVGVVALLANPKLLQHLPAGFDAGENGQFRQVMSPAFRFTEVERGYEAFSDDQIERVLNLTRHARDRFLVLLVLLTGMSIGEALGLRREDMHLLANSTALGCSIEGPHVHVRRRRDNANGALAKSRFPRAIPVTADLVGAYTEYYERDDIPVAVGCDMVLVNLFRAPLGAPVTYSATKDLFDRLAREAGFPVRPHMLRHTAATRWVRAGVDRDVVQHLLGHASSASLQPYLHPNEKDKRDAVERVAAARGGAALIGALTVAASAQPAAVVDTEAWKMWLRRRLSPCWREGEWDPTTWTFTGNPDNPSTSIVRCRTVNCPSLLAGRTVRFCSPCDKTRAKSGLSAEDFAASHPAVRSASPGSAREPCRVSRDGLDCARSAACMGMCDSHYAAWYKHARRAADTGQTVEPAEWIARHATPVLATLPACLVPACRKLSCSGRALCYYHVLIWRQAHRDAGGRYPSGVGRRTDPLSSWPSILFVGAARAAALGGALRAATR